MTLHSHRSPHLATDKEGVAQKDEVPDEGVTVPQVPDLESRCSELQLASSSTTGAALGRLFAAEKSSSFSERSTRILNFRYVTYLNCAIYLTSLGLSALVHKICTTIPHGIPGIFKRHGKCQHLLNVNLFTTFSVF